MNDPGRSRNACSTQRRLGILFLLFFAGSQAGCILGRQHPAATQPATAIDPREAKPAFWWDKPAVAKVTAPSFDLLWNACRDSAEADGFTIDRTDYREGVLTTLPLDSQQVYEVWRNDIASGRDLAQATIGSMRRTIHFTIRRLDDGSFEATPKVLVDRDSLIERRVTSVDQYQAVFSIQAVDVVRETEKEGEAVQAEYWYPVARDYALERRLAEEIRRRLNRK